MRGKLVACVCVTKIDIGEIRTHANEDDGLNVAP